jgi:hypothetical protein
VNIYFRYRYGVHCNMYMYDIYVSGMMVHNIIYVIFLY